MLAAVGVFRAQHVIARAQLPIAEVPVVTGSRPLEDSAADVDGGEEEGGRRRVAEGDEIAYAVVISGQADALRRGLVDQAHIAIARSFRTQVRIADVEARIIDRPIQIVESRRAKGGTDGGRGAPGGGELVSIAQRTGIVAAELRIVVAARAHLQRVRTQPELVAADERVGASFADDICHAVRIHHFHASLGREQQFSAAQGNIVLPHVLILGGAKTLAADTSRDRIQIVAGEIVLAAAEAQFAGPVRREAVARVDRRRVQRLLLIIVEIVGANGVAGVAVRGVEMRRSGGVEQARAQLVVGIETLGDLRRQVAIAVRIAIRIVAIGAGLGRGKAAAVGIAQVDVEACIPGPAAVFE